jgi:small subunit ribosomal protein S12
MGEFSARTMHKKRMKFRWNDTDYKSRKLQLWKKDPLKGSPQGKGIVIEKKNIEQKQPHSGLIKCVRVQLIKNGIQVTAFVPGTGAIAHITEHDEVTIESVGGSQGGPIGSQWGVKYKVSAVNGISLNELVSGRKQKPTR